MVVPGVKVDQLIVEGEQVVGVRAGEDELRAHVVVAADGVNSFLAYTKDDSVSIGVVLRLDDLAAKGLVPSAVHDYFLQHPAIAPLLEGGELLEYGCHLTIEDGPKMVSHDITRPGLILIGDAAGFTLNTGLTVRGMDLAAGSAIAAAAAINKALDAGDYSQAAVCASTSPVDIDWASEIGIVDSAGTARVSHCVNG